MDCAKIFIENKGKKTLCPKIDSIHPECECEKVSVSEFSPGIIEDDEILLRPVFTDDHLADKFLSPAALSDDKDCGLSVLRKKHCGKLEFERIIKEIFYGKEVKGVAKIKAKDVKGIIENKKRIYCVYDTSEEKNISHSDICLITCLKSFRKEMRKILIEKFGEVLSVEQIFQ